MHAKQRELLLLGAFCLRSQVGGQGEKPLALGFMAEKPRGPAAQSSSLLSMHSPGAKCIRGHAGNTLPRSYRASRAAAGVGEGRGEGALK